jgi:hypothetical protein
MNSFHVIFGYIILKLTVKYLDTLPSWEAQSLSQSRNYLAYYVTVRFVSLSSILSQINKVQRLVFCDP